MRCRCIKTKITDAEKALFLPTGTFTTEEGEKIHAKDISDILIIYEAYKRGNPVEICLLDFYGDGGKLIKNQVVRAGVV